MDPKIGSFIRLIQKEFLLRSLGFENGCYKYSLDLSCYRIKASTQTPFIISEITTDDQYSMFVQLGQAIRSYYSNDEETISIICFSTTERFSHAIFKESFPDVLLIYLSDIEELLLSTNLHQDLLKIIRKKINLDVLSPYQTGGSVKRSMFYGRERETRQLLRGRTSFSVWGMRRIGKTSLLNHVRSILITDRQISESRVIYRDCSDLTSPYDLFKAISLPLLHTKLAESMDFSQFSSFLRSYSRDGKDPFILILDEIDHLIEVDANQGRNLQSLLRAAYKSGYCRFIFSGFFETKRERLKLESPLFNFTEDVELKGLSLQESRRLVAEPLHDLDVTISQIVIDNIFHETRGQPVKIQHICQKLLEKIDYKSSRCITQEDFEEILQDPSIDIMDENLFNENTSPLEKLIVHLEIQREEFNLRQIVNNLNRHQIYPNLDTIRYSLDVLKLIGIIKEVGETYRFSSERFVRSYQSRDLDFSLKAIIDQGALRQKFHN